MGVSHCLMQVALFTSHIILHSQNFGFASGPNRPQRSFFVSTCKVDIILTLFSKRLTSVQLNPSLKLGVCYKIYFRGNDKFEMKQVLEAFEFLTLPSSFTTVLIEKITISE